MEGATTSIKTEACSGGRKVGVTWVTWHPRLIPNFYHGHQTPIALHCCDGCHPDDSEETRASVLETQGQEAKVRDRLPPKKPAAGAAS